MNTDAYYNPLLEWESISDNEEITSLKFRNGIYNLPENCIIQFKRNENYKLFAKISGIVNSRNQLGPTIKPELGDFRQMR